MDRTTTAPRGTGSEREIVSTRLIHAPRERVFEAFADPAQVALWWGPRGFTNTIHEMDLRPGGKWRLTMHGPDGIDYANESIFDEVVAPERVVYRHLRTMHKFRMTMLLEAGENGTRLTWRMLFPTARHCEAVRRFVPNANEENFDRLEAHLATAQDA